MTFDLRFRVLRVIFQLGTISYSIRHGKMVLSCEFRVFGIKPTVGHLIFTFLGKASCLHSSNRADRYQNPLLTVRALSIVTTSSGSDSQILPLQWESGGALPIDVYVAISGGRIRNPPEGKQQSPSRGTIADRVYVSLGTTGPYPGYVPAVPRET